MSSDSKNGYLIDNYIKFIPLSEEKTIFCFDEHSNGTIISYAKFKCGLAQIQNNKIKINDQIYISDKNINKDSKGDYLNKNILDGVKINDQQVILIYYDYQKKDFYQVYNKIYYIKITITNNKLSMESTYTQTISYTYSSAGFYSLYLLKNNDDNLVSITVFNDVASFKEYGYINCTNSSINLYNGDNNHKITFNLVSLFEINEIIFLSKSYQKIYSIIDEKSKPIKYSVIYNKKNISYNYNPKDYDYIKNNNINLLFTC
jgi:hypothetical protein